MRRKLSIGLSLACLLAFTAFAQAPQGVTTEKDVIYGNSDGVDLKMDIVKPAPGPGPVPAVVCIHGGAWQVGSKNDYGLIAGLVASHGFVAAAVEYRLAPKHKWPAQIEVVKCAVRYLRAHAKELNSLPDKIGAVGDSAGGHLSLLLGLMDPKDGLEGKGGNLEQSSKVQAVVNLYGPTDLRLWHATPEAEAMAKKDMGKGFEDMMVDLLGTSDRKAPVMAQMSPVMYISAGDAPILTFHGNKDIVVPVEQGKLLHAALEKAGLTQKLVIVEDAGHGLDPLQLATAAQQAFEFFDLHLLGKKPAAPPSAAAAK